MTDVQTSPPAPRTAEDLFEPALLAKYDPKAVELVVATANAGRPRPHDFPIAEVRADEARFEAPWCRDPTGWPRVTAGAAVPSADGTPVPVMVYHPDPAVHGPGPYGVHLNFHGGGFVLGGLKSESTLCRSMSEGAGVVVVDVNYRHCPEAEYGKCMEDAWAAVQWVREKAGQLNTKADSVSVGGVSAGGAISLVLQHMARDAGVPLRLCMATVPPASTALTYASPAESPYPSFREFANGPVLPWASIKLFGEYCFPRDQLEARLARIPGWWLSPILAPNFAGLCDTFIRTAECDVLRDEGEAYGMKSIAAGNRVTMKRYLGSPHTFMSWDSFPQKQEYDRDSIHALRLAHGFS